MPMLGDTISPEDALAQLYGDGNTPGSTTIGVDGSTTDRIGPIHSQGPHPGQTTESDPKDQVTLVERLKAAGLTMDEINALLGNGDGSSGGGSGGGSSFDPMQAELESTYFRLWGKRAPAGVIQQALSAGLNVFQFEDQIRQDPAFRRSETYQNEMADNSLALARLLGIIPG